MTIRHVACLLVALAIGSCGETDRSEDQAREGRALFQESPDQGAWRIVVASVRGPGRATAAMEL
ncbi:MAG: hypothetical protein KDA28_16705, partial [Phycisphaerales bacterium]|nr:hypothetical protein [Phycisphaerales bacterium]